MSSESRQSAKDLLQGERVKEYITSFIENRLKLKVNQEKSAIDRPWKRKFLGFSFTRNKDPKVRVAPQSMKKVKADNPGDYVSEETTSHGTENYGTQSISYRMGRLLHVS